MRALMALLLALLLLLPPTLAPPATEAHTVWHSLYQDPLGQCQSQYTWFGYEVHAYGDYTWEGQYRAPSSGEYFDTGIVWYGWRTPGQIVAGEFGWYYPGWWSGTWDSAVIIRRNGNYVTTLHNYFAVPPC